MLIKTRAIALHYVKYGESSLIACFYTEKLGRQSCMVSSARKKKSSFPASFFLPLTLLEIDFYHRARRDIQQIKEVNCLMHFSSIPFNIHKSTIALFISELLYKTLKEEEANPALFDFLFNAIQLLDLKEVGSRNFHLAFLLHYMKYLGIFPFMLENERMTEGRQDFILPADAGDDEKEGLNQLMHSSLGQLENIRITNKTRCFLLDRIIDFYLYHLDQMAEIRSLQVLKEVFHK
jgi:DNA repair protein RecO (recombination protein O)